MAHAFDTQLSAPQRTTVRNAIVERLEGWDSLAYLKAGAVKAIAGIIKAGTEDEIDRVASEAGSISPMVCVALGDKVYSPRGEGSPADSYEAQLEVHIYAISRNLRSPLARLEGDAVSAADEEADPGCEVILEHLEEALLGFKPAPSWNPTVYQLVPAGEAELEVGEDYAIWRLSMRIRLARELARHRTATTPITQIRARHHVDGAEQQNPIVEHVTEIQ